MANPQTITRITDDLAVRIASMVPLHGSGLEDVRCDAAIMSVPGSKGGITTTLVITARGPVWSAAGGGALSLSDGPRVLVVMTAVPEFGYCSDEQLEAAVAEGCEKLRGMKRQGTQDE